MSLAGGFTPPRSAGEMASRTPATIAKDLNVKCDPGIGRRCLAGLGVTATSVDDWAFRPVRVNPDSMLRRRIATVDEAGENA